MPFSAVNLANNVEDLIQLKKYLADVSPAENRCLPYRKVKALNNLIKEIGDRFDLEDLEEETDLHTILHTIIYKVADQACFTLDNGNPLSLSPDSQNGNLN